jgi:hypothetical protein
MFVCPRIELGQNRRRKRRRKGKKGRRIFQMLLAAAASVVKFRRFFEKVKFGPEYFVASAAGGS